MRRGGGGRQRVPKVPPSTPAFDPPTGIGEGISRRDSDASSLCSSRPSSAGGRNPNSSALLDRSSHSSALHAINAYLSSHSDTFFLKSPLPSGRDVIDCFRFLLSRLDFPLPPSSNSNTHFEDEILAFIKNLGCPVKISRSALKAPSTPTSWPAVVSILYWLLQLARYSDHPQDSAFSAESGGNDLLFYIRRSYSLYISGQDSSVEELDEEHLGKLKHQAKNAADSIESLSGEEDDLRSKLHRLRSEPSRKEALVAERNTLLEDVKKFEAVVESFKGQVAGMEGKLKEWEGELKVKESENKRLSEENEALKGKVEGQVMGVRDVERMRKEIQAVERDAAEAEVGRNAMEEKAWELEADIGRKFKDLEALVEECNHANRKLKLASDLQYMLNANGSSPAKVMGIDYKSTIKPALAALSEETKQASVSKLEELISLQQQSRENATMLEEKRSCLAMLQAKVGEAEARLSSLKKERVDHAHKCAIEAEKLSDEFTRKEQQLSIVEKEAEDFLKSSEQKLQDATRECDEETQSCANEFLKLIDDVSEYKEYMESVSSGMKSDVAELAKFLGDTFRASPASSSHVVSSSPNLSLKRARYPSPVG